MELMGALLAVRLARKIRDWLETELEAVRYFTDLTAVLGMILRELATYQEFVSTRVNEIKTKSDPETEWFLTPGEQNIADMGTRPTVMLKDMGPGTPYQEGLPWMRKPPEAWPIKKTFMSPPSEECKKDKLAMVKAVRIRSQLWYPPSADTRAKLERVYGYVYTFLAKFKKHSDFTPVSVRTRGTGKEAVTTYGPPAEPNREAVRLCLLQDTQTSRRSRSSRWEAGRRSICGWHTIRESCPSSRVTTPCPGYTWKRPTGWTTRELTQWS
jgi:hypothetical protein